MADLLPTVLASASARRNAIFRPFAMKKAQYAEKTGQQFIHYTSAATATLILKNTEVWMRQSSAMNDFREIEFGQACIRRAWLEHGERFEDVFGKIDPKMSVKLWDWFVSWEQRVRTETYIACVSEHRARENTHGRLSMWRAYGGNSGVGLVLDGGPLLRVSDALGAYASPVGYHTLQSFSAAFERLIERAEKSFDFLVEQGAEQIYAELCHTLHFAMLCTKHEGFRDEREWRIVRSPAFNTPLTLSARVEVIGGVPQTILALALKDQPNLDLVGIEVPKLVKRVIVGPSKHPLLVAEALATCLKASGVQSPENIIAFSDIPLRS
ncbi:DUF2971 domain-containing protein [Devosia sp.]|uniref:DUF2971 domain-containing protein n=1 Tax=Devosia sp. TaxID=1871048 RepID=UPI002736A522|nr:DUF2971 domain-containing protein [Devosia sp.]MDP2782170.1 DUF2971 domain-containing protein [Devosia sp.]